MACSIYYIDVYGTLGYYDMSIVVFALYFGRVCFTDVS